MILLILRGLTLNLADVLRVFPYYSQLDSILRGIPSFDSKLVSSRPNANHASNFLDLLNGRSAKDGGLDEGDDVEEDRAADDAEGGPTVTNNLGGPAATDDLGGPAATDDLGGPAATGTDLTRGPTMTNFAGRPAATNAVAMRGPTVANTVGGHAAGDGEEGGTAAHNVAAGPTGGTPASQMRDDIYNSGFDDEYQMDTEEAEIEGQQVCLFWLCSPCELTAVCPLQTPVAGTPSRGRVGVPASRNKPRTSSRDSRNAFATRPSPYSRPPPSASAMSYTSATKRVPSGGGTMITKRIEDLDKESDLFQAEIEDVKTRHAALRYNYAIRDKELDVRKEELNFERSNAELAFRWEQDLRMLDIEYQKAQESTFAQQVQVLNLQIRLRELDRCNESSTGGPSRG